MSSKGQLTGDSELFDIVESFPDDIVHSFGYGSGVFTQQLEHATTPGSPSSGINRPMLDLILVVDNAQEWHERNIQQHPHHYSTICRCLGGNFCATLQRNHGAGVFFNALVQDHTSKDRLIKYGIVQLEEMKRDLEFWDYLYLAGRMHKPTVVISTSDEITELQETRNLPYALATSLLLSARDSSPQEAKSSSISMPLEQIYERIANLSYAGDIRMNVGGEDPNKVMKLVHSPGQLERFHELYRGPLEQMEQQGLLSVTDGTTVEWDSTLSGRKALWGLLPPPLAPIGGNLSSLHLAAALTSIVAPAARNQSLKGILTAGFVKSIRYASAKFAKGAFRHFQ